MIDVPIYTGLKGDFRHCYFAVCPVDGAIKIGVTGYPVWARMFEIRRCGVRAQALFGLTGGNQTEAALHAHFEPIHLGGEWFAPTAELTAAIAEIQAGSFDWSAIPQRGWCITKPYQTKASLAHWGPLPSYRQAA